MKKVLVAVWLLAILAMSGPTGVYASTREELEELFLVAPEMTVDWFFELEGIHTGAVKGQLLPGNMTDSNVWFAQGCVNNFCFMDMGGPPESLENESIQCQMRIFTPSEIEAGNLENLKMSVSVDGKEAMMTTLYALCIQPVEANFVAGEKPVLIKEKETDGCTPVRTISEKSIKSASAPTIRNGRMMIPFRLLGEIIGAEVEWNASTSEASYTLGPKRVILRKGIPSARIVMPNTQRKVNMETAPDIISGSTMIPLRFVTDVLGGSVTWDGATRTAIVNFPGCGE
ncbi:MAG TPA: copper amine oxidase N-terminal domain-containing protein [Caldisericia bacterium]|nr:copper amine oxidase N-terminal domain-containing protein [Caldisericia bacterium]HPF49408.1 copper amine oxidase N-terminal domain-containing protein [Caldisericia bacterium]HPI84389.1 copper amine oxidase N-terminal domain-containing protein [Caldisericia bacterium]HPQ93579.1 copper amine oxidase N-terminal domain-containing protein [Caldisericia bacterium]HRV75548.1 copper amine oxidase N-terminal domain-containing protein [Caldisericia bacterium]